jgi:hypothetical protein
MKKLLLLHNRYTPDDGDIWRAAIQAGWKTQRTDFLRVEQHIAESGCDHVRYYGNTLHAEQIKNRVPFEFVPLCEDYHWLTQAEMFTQRKIEIVRFGALKQPFDNDIFVKPLNHKWFEGKVYKAGESISGACGEEDYVYVSQIVDMVDEIRCFVLDGKVVTASFYRINKIFDPQPVSEALMEGLSYETKAICETFKLPRGVVLDFAPVTGWRNKFRLIEANEAYASGLYLCDPAKCFEVIQASQVDRPKKVSETA